MSQPIEDIPGYEVQRENDPLKKKLLYRNMLLPFRGLPYIDGSEKETGSITPEPSSAEEEPTATSIESSTDSEAEGSRARNEPAQICVIPPKRGQDQRNLRDRKRSREDRDQTDSWRTPPRRGNRKR